MRPPPYSYSGHVAAYAYRQIDPSMVRRVFLLGPSHHYYTKRCCLSTASVYETPLGSIAIDQAVVEDLANTGQFEVGHGLVTSDQPPAA